MKNPEATLQQKQKQQTSTESPREESFLRRWSQRKLGVSTATDEMEVEAQQLEVNSGNPEPDQSQHQPQRELTDEDMPPLESLDENSDYSGFFSPKVSESLRQQALRKLFHFQKFNVTDGLNDYDEDYTQYAKLGNIVTHEMKRLLDLETKKFQAGQPSEDHLEDNKVADNTDNENNDLPDSSDKPIKDEVTDS